MFHLLRQLKENKYYQRNQALILLLFAWLFRICFLTQGNAGGVAINKYVLIQIVLILCIFFRLSQLHMTPFILLKYPSCRSFALIFLLGMASIIWSVFPLMSCFFAFENIVCMMVLFYLGSQCHGEYQLERVFIWMTVTIIGMFFIRNVTGGNGWHSVTYSSVAAMLTMYCIGEYGDNRRPMENKRMLRFGLWVGIFTLAVTTSGGALFSVGLSLLFLSFLGKSRFVKILALCIITVMIIMWYLGADELVLSVLFPGKSTDSILTGHGRTVIWAWINEKVVERPWFGWGYAAVERILPIYCVDAHNSIVGIRGALGNIGCALLIYAMVYQLFYCFKNTRILGFKGLFLATACAFINSNTTNFLAAKAGPCALVFLFLIILAAVYKLFDERKYQRRNYGTNDAT